MTWARRAVWAITVVAILWVAALVATALWTGQVSVSIYAEMGILAIVWLAGALAFMEISYRTLRRKQQDELPVMDDHPDIKEMDKMLDDIWMETER